MAQNKGVGEQTHFAEEVFDRKNTILLYSSNVPQLFSQLIQHDSKRLSDPATD
jgi:hypothetical protein